MAFWFTFFLWVASFVISDYFRAKLPAQEPSGEGDFQSPTATEGRKVPQVVGGTVKIKGPNTLFYGDWEAVPVTVETGLIFKRDETVGYTYAVALALGQFQGRAAGMTAIYIGDDKVWDYVADNGSVPGTVADIDLPELFGGETQGGGFQGRVRAFTGENNQPVSTYLAGKNPLQSAWPGFVYVVVTSLDETAGATLGESNQLRDIRIEWQNYDTIANGGLGNDLSLTGDKHIIGRDANPISAAYKVLNDPDFSIATGDINTVNFQAVADVCYTEGIGYSQVIDSELEAYEILAEIEKHIDGYIGPNPTNGLLEVKLARNDYTASAEYQATEANIVALKNYAKPEWPQTKNEVKLRFVNRDKDYTDDHAVAQDMAGRLIAGRPQSLTIRFPGVRDAAVANLMVTRTSRGYFWPIAKFELELDRTAYALRPGDIVMVTHPDINATDLPTRITRVRTGDLVNQTIKVDVVEDVFQHELVGIAAAPPASGHVPASDLAVAVTNRVVIDPPRWIYERDGLAFEPRPLHLIARDSPNNAYNIEFRTRSTAFGGNITPAQEDQKINTFVGHGTMRAIETSPVESPALALDMLRAASNNGTALVTEGGGFYVDGALGSLAGTYDPIAYVPGNTGLAVINPGQENEEWIAITTITAVTGGILCEGVIRCIGDSIVRQHYEGEDFYFVDTGMYLQANARVSETDGNYGYLSKIRPYAPSGVGSYGSETEVRVSDDRTKVPYPPTNVRPTQIGPTWFPTGGLDASVPNNTNLPATNGFTFHVYNRRFDQDNPIAGANSLTDNLEGYLAANFVTYAPTLNWWLYNLDETPNPVQGTDAILSGASLNENLRINSLFFNQSDFQGIKFLRSGFNCRFEFNFENAASPGVDGVLAGVQSAVQWSDHTVLFYPDPESKTVVNDTLLLLHFDGEDRTTQVLDYSIYNHPVTLSGNAAVEIDTSIPSPVFGSPDNNSGHLKHPPQFPQSPEQSPNIEDYYCEVTDVSPNAFQNLSIDPGFSMQARVLFTATPTGEVPIITKWREGDNERQFWFGMSGTAIRTKLSANGTNESIFTTGTRTWNLNQWYEITVTLWKASATQYRGYFFVDGLWDEFEFGSGGIVPDLLAGLHDSAAPVRIGSDGDGNTVPATTYFDEVRIVNLPIYKIQPYTQQTAQFPGRECVKILHCNWENIISSPTTQYLTDDLNRWTVDFPANEVTHIDQTVSKFGNNSLFCGGVSATGFDNSDGVAIDGSGPTQYGAETWEWGLDDFTMECFVRFAILPSAHTGGTIGLIMTRFRGTTPYVDWRFSMSTASQLVFEHYETTALGQAIIVGAAPSPEIAINTWYHCAAVRKDGVMSLYFEGEQVATEPTLFANRKFNNTRARTTLGRMEQNNTSDHWVLNGWLDEVRVQVGVAEYDGPSYTVPVAAFPVDPLPETYVPPSPQSPFTPPSPQSPFTPAPAAGNLSNWQPSNL